MDYVAFLEKLIVSPSCLSSTTGGVLAAGSSIKLEVTQHINNTKSTFVVLSKI